MTSSNTPTIQMDWHQDDADEQAILSATGGAIRIVIALPVDVSRTTLDEVLAEIRRELDRFGE